MKLYPQQSLFMLFFIWSIDTNQLASCLYCWSANILHQGHWTSPGIRWIYCLFFAQRSELESLAHLLQEWTLPLCRLWAEQRHCLRSAVEPLPGLPLYHSLLWCHILSSVQQLGTLPQDPSAPQLQITLLASHPHSMQLALAFLLSVLILKEEGGRRKLW